MRPLLKLAVDAFTAPLTLALAVLLIGLLCRWRGWKKLSVTTLSIALAIAYLGSLSVVGDGLIGPLERQYAPFAEGDLPSDAPTSIVVLGSGYRPRQGLPVTAAFDEEGLARIVEGVRLWRHSPDARLIVSGGAPSNMTPSALGYARLARELGVPEQSLTILDRPLDTNQESRTIALLMESRPFLLVTSASHMPRAMRLMQRVGARPIPAPTGHRALGMPAGCWRCWLPTAAGLRKTERAVHEYLGLMALQLGME